MRRLTLLGVALLSALALSIPGAFAKADSTASASATPGITARTIKIGGTFPLTGAAALYGTAASVVERAPCSVLVVRLAHG